MTDRPPQRDRYLIELATPDAGWHDIERVLKRARRDCGENGSARFIRSLYVPEDSRFYLLYEAESAEQARLAAAGAELEVAGVSQAVHPDKEES
jgi:hypothetical protein